MCGLGQQMLKAAAPLNYHSIVHAIRIRVGKSTEVGAICEGLGDSLLSSARRAGGQQLGKIVPFGGSEVSVYLCVLYADLALKGFFVRIKS